MNCDRFEELITDSLDGQLTAALARDFEQHRASCDTCPQLVEDVQRLISLCREFPEARPPVTLAEQILNATVGEPRRIPFRSFFRFPGMERFFHPKFAFGMALVICFVGLGVRVLGPEQDPNVSAPQAILTRLDRLTHQIYSQGVRVFETKNRLVGEYEYLKTTLFNQIDYHLSQISGQAKEPAPKPAPTEEPKTKEEKKSWLFSFIA